ncbi:MerR family transcriptional regulator [Priestia megaterium]
MKRLTHFAPQRTKGNARIYSEEEVKELRKVAEAKEVLGFLYRSCSSLCRSKE